MKTAVIIGGGLGGLFTGALLSHEGFKVTVLEKNSTAGGGLQNFRRFGMKFDTGMHIIGGMHPGGNIYRICQYLGIADRVQLRDVDDDCTDSLYFAEDRTTYVSGGAGRDLSVRWPGISPKSVPGLRLTSMPCSALRTRSTSSICALPQTPSRSIPPNSVLQPMRSSPGTSGIPGSAMS